MVWPGPADPRAGLFYSRGFFILAVTMYWRFPPSLSPSPTLAVLLNVYRCRSLPTSLAGQPSLCNVYEKMLISAHGGNHHPHERGLRHPRLDDSRQEALSRGAARLSRFSREDVEGGARGTE